MKQNCTALNVGLFQLYNKIEIFVLFFISMYAQFQVIHEMLCVNLHCQVCFISNKLLIDNNIESLL